MTRNPAPVVLLNDTRVDQHHGCSRVMMAIEHLLGSNDCEIIGVSPAHSDWTRNTKFLSALERSRLVVVNGEGTIHHDRAAGRKLLEVGAYAKYCGIPSALVNAGWEANSAELITLMQDFSLVSVRDSLSKAEIQNAGQSCQVVPDLSLYGRSVEHAGVRQGIAFTDSVDRITAITLNSLRCKMDAATLPILFGTRGIKGRYKFLRNGVAVRDIFQPIFLLQTLRQRFEQYLTFMSSTQEYLQKLSMLELLVSGRFHACTLALTTRTPFISVSSNTKKITALVRDAGLQEWRATANLGRRDVEQARSMSWGAGELEAVESYLNEAKRGAESLFKEIRRQI